MAPPPTLTANDPDTSQVVGTEPVRKEERDEDSGLHDIRNLAQSTKQRLSSRRITAQPIADDVLASSSGSFKNIALPQPAKMVSLPALDELPSKAEVVAAEKAAEKAAKKAAKEAKEAKKVDVVAPAAVAAPAVAEAKPAVETPAVSRQAFSLPSQQRKSTSKSKTGLFAVIGIGLAAAAGAVIYVQTSKSTSNSAAPAVADQSTAKVETVAVAPPVAGSAVTAEPIAPPPAEPAVEAPEETAAGAAQIAADEGKDGAEEDKAADTKSHRKAGKATKHTIEKDTEKVEQKKVPDKTEKADKNAKPDPKGDGEQEPSFDALLKEAGVTEKKEAKPKLAKKKLTGSDFKTAMDGVEGKAKACYKGTVGTVMVHMTIEPDGTIKKLTVGGAFAGKPEASCVQAAMKSAKFPPWDGAPQSFSYAVMLSD